MTDSERDEMEQIVAQWESEAPWETCGKTLDHAGWLDLVSTLKAVWPVAYEAMRRDVMGRKENYAQR